MFKKFTSYIIIKQRPTVSRDPKDKETKELSKLETKEYRIINRTIQKIILEKDTTPVPEEHLRWVNELQTVLKLPVYVQNKSTHLEYDITINPERYVRAYLNLSRLYESYGLNMFNFTPLSASTIPRHVTIDSTLLAKCILECKVPENLKDDSVKSDLWNRFFKLEKKEFKPKKNKGIQFEGTIRTDGISLCILMSPKFTKYMTKEEKQEQGIVKLSKKAKNEANKENYFQEIEVSKFKKNKVFIDPNKRDLLYCLGP
jgi:hypothetical protein